MPAGTEINSESPAIPSASPDMKLKGVRGWLFLFCLGPTLTPVLSLLAIVSWISPIQAAYIQFEPSWTIAGRISLLLAGAAINVLLFVYSIYTASALWKMSPMAIRRVASWLGLVFIIGLLDSMISANVSAFIRQFVGVLIWGSYFQKSKRVMATYGRNL